MLHDLLVGSTGFVGGNLAASHAFYASCHSTNIARYYGSHPGLCVYAGVPAAMFLANNNPEADLEVVRQARENIRGIAPEKLVLISTIAVYADSRRQAEDDAPSRDKLPAYGLNRLQLEQWVREDFPQALIVRLPALYGIGLKKNFLFDLLTLTPAMLTAAKFAELAGVSPLIRRGYSLADNGFYQPNGTVDAAGLRTFFEHHSFNALSFTDSRSRYQFYNLTRLWSDISLAVKAGLSLLHLATPPVSAAEVYESVTGFKGWVNELPKTPFDYDLHTNYAFLLGGSGSYLCTKDEEMADICTFMKQANR